jgi:hypothetical protein
MMPLLCNSGPLMALAMICFTIIVCVLLPVIGKWLR